MNIKVSDLAEWTPHRPPMVWIDEVISVTATEGECRAQLKKDGLYMHFGILPLSSLIEFVAQAYAYVRCVQAQQGLGSKSEKPKRAFLVGTGQTDFFIKESDSRIAIGQELRFHVSEIREILPFVMFTGKVLAPDGFVIMSTKIKLFHQ